MVIQQRDERARVGGREIVCERDSVCVCERESERKSMGVCACERGCEYMPVRDGERKSVGVCIKSETECDSVLV